MFVDLSQGYLISHVTGIVLSVWAFLKAVVVFARAHAAKAEAEAKVVGKKVASFPSFVWAEFKKVI